jgi:shikimate kinase
MHASAETEPSTRPQPAPAAGAAAVAPALPRSLVLVGLMGAGKSSIGRRLAKAMGAPFADADDEIVAAAGMSIPEIFEGYGEPKFRDLERRVVARLLGQPPMVLALGGGAFVDPSTRARVKASALSVWLRADLETLLARTMRKRGARPLLRDGDPRATLERLMGERYPVYAEADHVVDTSGDAPEAIVARILGLMAGGGGGDGSAEGPG